MCWLLLRTAGAGDPGASESTVTAGPFAQVLLVVIFSIIELRSLTDFSRDWAEAVVCQHLLEKAKLL